MKLYVGTSGYSYKEWVGSFYPTGTKAPDYLEYYSRQLPAVEINNTFYKTPDADTVSRWAQATPARFRFAVKSSRRITHQKRLRDCGESLEYQFDRYKAFGTRLGCVLYQLPPNAKADPERLSQFLDLLPKKPISAFEFRHPSWFSDEVYSLLRKNKAALVYSDGEIEGGMPFVSTADWGYLRLRDEQMDKSAVRKWAGRVLEQKWKQAFVFFKHEDEGRGAELAREFLQAAEAR